MRLVYTLDVPRIGVVRTFRHPRLGPAVGLVIIAGATAWWALAVTLADDSHWYHWIPMALGFLVGLVTAGSVRKAMQPANWLVTLAQDGMYVKLRSYLNSHFPEAAPIVLHLPYSEIASVQAVKKRLNTPTRGGGISMTSLTSLEIALNHSGTVELELAIRAERALRPVKNGTAKFHDYALRLAGPNTLHIRWNVSPGLSRALESLRPFVPVNDSVTEVAVTWNSADESTRDAVIAELAEFGEKLAAQRLAADRFGFSDTEAIEYIEGIMEGLNPRARQKT